MRAVCAFMAGWAMTAGCAMEGGCDREVTVSALAVCVNLAVTAEERRRGLRGREPLAEGEGLLLRFPTEGEVCLVNDDVSTPVDAVFFDGRGAITALLQLPADDTTARCAGPARDVLEIPGGASDGLAIGMLGALP